MATYLTKAGLAKLQQELKDLRKQKRILEEEVRKARALGDLRENAEFHAAKERLAQVVERITEIQYKLSHVEVVDPTQHASETAILGCCVTVKDLTSGDLERYVLAGPDEADPSSGRISTQSPMGRAFLGKKVNEQVTVQLPAGVRAYQILKIELAE